jgi:hypothetical protein
VLQSIGQAPAAPSLTQPTSSPVVTTSPEVASAATATPTSAPAPAAAPYYTNWAASEPV